MASTTLTPRVPKTDGRPPVQSVEFIRELRRLVRDVPDTRWEADEESRRVRAYWDNTLEYDEDVYQVGQPRDADMADLWFGRLFIEEDDFYTDDPAAWNHPVFQEFLSRWWHPATILPVFAPNDPSTAEPSSPLGPDQVGCSPATCDAPYSLSEKTDTSKEDTPEELDSQTSNSFSSDDAAGAHTRENPPDRPAPETPRRPGADTGSFYLISPPATEARHRTMAPETWQRPDTRVERTEAAPSSSLPPRGPVPTTRVSSQIRQVQQPTSNITQPLQPNLSDMERPHTWRDQRQPPMGARLLQILNWVNDEDIDRRRDWARELSEAEDWVREQLDRRDENGLGDDTITLLRQAEAAMQAHRRNERYHYRTFMDLKIPNPDALPKYAPRLPYDSEIPIELGIAGPRVKKSKGLPQLPNIPRPWQAVNDMWMTEREAALSLDPKLPAARDTHLKALAEAEERLWAPRAGQPAQTSQNNELLAENTAYAVAVADPDGGLQSGWVHWQKDADDQEEVRTLADSDERLSNSAEDFAVERGVRRAGLQAALRQFHSTENHLIANNGRMLVLPGGTKAEAVPDLEEVKRKAGIGNSRPITLTELPASQMKRTDGKADPQGFIANMAQFWREARQATLGAHEYAMARTFRHSPDGALHPAPQDENKPLPPRSPFGPFVWRGVPAKVQLRQDCLRQMRGLKRLFDREKHIGPRQLLADMEAAYQRGYGLDQDPSDLLQLEYDRDTKPGPPLENDPDAEQKPHYLSEVEMEWLRFLLNHSMTEGMASELLPRTAIFQTFAERLERIFNDPGDSLFPDTKTSVTIEDLIAHMAKMKGPVNKTTFYVYDVKMYLERLAYQGRCRYTEDWRTYGRVQRPLLRYFPEDLIIWQPRDGASADPDNYPEDARPATPRFEDLRTWEAIVHQDPPATLPGDVRNYFLCLAYRWGHGTRRLEVQERSWGTTQPLPLPNCRMGINRLSNGFELHAGDGVHRDNARPVSVILEDLWRRTLNKPDSEMPPNGTTAIEQIQKAVIHEVVRADNMLYPGRSTDYRDPLAPKTRDSIWDWAKPGVRGKSKRFFSLDRWPVQLQNAKTQQRIKDDVDIDPDMVWNPIVEDPTPWTYYRPKAKPYGEDRVEFKSGQRLFPIGDTVRQREMVKRQVIAMVGSGEIFPRSLLSGRFAASTLETHKSQYLADRETLLQQWALCQTTALQMAACSQS